MSFKGVIHDHARQVLATYIPKLPKAGAEILCCGNLSIATVLAMNGYQGPVTASDVSLKKLVKKLKI